MEAYPLQQLLTVREYREQSAVRAVKAAERTLGEAEEAVRRKKMELEAWRAWRRIEEDRRYAAIMGRPTTIEGLDEFKAGLALLAAEEARKGQEAEAAEQHAEDCRGKLKTAAAAAKAARKNTAKLETHRGIWAEEAKKEAEHKEDLELEEFRPVSRLGAMAEDEDR